MAKTQRFLSAPVGYGLDNTPQDITAAKRKLRELGFYTPRDAEDGDDFDAGFDKAIQNFQSRAGLRVDGVMKPGGETERNIEAYRTGEGFEAQPHPAAARLKGSVGAGGENAPEDVVAAKRALAASGRYGYDRTRPPSPYTDEKLVEAMRGLARDHDLFENGTIDPDSPVFQAMIREAEDGIRGVFPPSVAERKEGETQTAALPFLIPLALAGARLAAPHIARILGSGAVRGAGSAATRAGGDKAGRSILGAAPALALGHAAGEAGKRAGAKQRMQTDIENAQIPPSPGEPLKPFPPFVTPIPEERGPSVTATPIPEQRKPEVEGYPADGPRMPDKVIFQSLENDEFFREIAILKRWGSERTKRLNHLTGQLAIRIAKEMGVKLDMGYGGFDSRGKYQSEFPLHAQGDLYDSSRPLANRSWLDIALTDEDTKAKLLINTADIYAKSGELKPREQKQVAKVLNNKKANMEFIALAKPRGDVDLEEYVMQFEPVLRQAIRRMKQGN